ncbi:prepilin peptidase [Zavarzinia compransoris]|uniref:prepilin peptidase n=1 Tax=Zavarzinia marina TaxID=2911065 RepID=UPI001F3DA864|nr:A24 family peptidase [Zavarzinia marina]MCF4164779.1 prepilin peptidase [Zavarzinia marina]
MSGMCTPVGDILMTIRAIADLLPPGAGFALAAVWGLLVGSFATVAVERWPAMIEGRLPPDALLRPGSRCLACDRPLSWLQATPLVGRLVLRGRCACGRDRLSWLWPAMEGGGVLVMVATLALTPGHVPAERALLLQLLAGFLYVAALVDGRSAYLPDGLTLGALWTGLVAAALSACGLDAIGAGDAVIGAATGWGAMAAVAAVGRRLAGQEALAPGDWKLMAAVGAWGGVPAVVLTALFGALAALALAPLVGRFAVAPDGERRGIPFGPGIALAALVVIAADLTPAFLFGYD